MTPNSLRFSFLVQINIDTCTIPASTRVLRASPLAHHAMHHHAQLATSPCRASKAHPWLSRIPTRPLASRPPIVAKHFTRPGRRVNGLRTGCMYKMHGQPPVCLAGSLLLSWGGRNLGERDLPFPALFMSRCSSLPSHPVLTFPPLCLWHQIIGIKFDSRASFFPPCCKSPSLSSLQFPASFSPTLPQPHIREKAHTKSEIPLNLSESSVRRVATVPPSCQFAHGPLCICDHLVSRPLLLPPSATLLLGWNARPPFGRVLRATTRL